MERITILISLLWRVFLHFHSLAQKPFKSIIWTTKITSRVKHRTVSWASRLLVGMSGRSRVRVSSFSAVISKSWLTSCASESTTFVEERGTKECNPL
ncbi:hypothetical protein BDR03DRAFT_969650 [Suillus americanus]|nr:hypothetical protein BDR03DRAFT_969650 [Suillus americanus]